MAKIFSDLDLVKAVQETGDNEAMKHLLASHSGLYCSILDKALPPEYAPIKSEILADKDYNMFKWALNFDPDKNMKYPVWVGQNVKWMCMNIYNRLNVNAYLEDNPIEPSYEHNFDDTEEKVLDEIKNLSKLFPDKRIETIVTDRYFVGRKPLPWKKIAKKLKTSPCQCLTIHKKFLEWAKPKLKKYL